MPAAAPLTAYRTRIALDEPFRSALTLSGRAERPGLVRDALRLLADDPAWARLGLRVDDAARVDDAGARRLLRAVLTVRDPGPFPEETTRALDALLDAERLGRPVTDATRLPLLAEEFPHTAYPSDLRGPRRLRKAAPQGHDRVDSTWKPPPTRSAPGWSGPIGCWSPPGPD
ncbi:hypothetical protein AB0451_39805 [Streptomyces sp. NPDC052000]|uniref:hypothetical protein n=1 Tax=Streptomyces sp. NPDC052000 TaxID=3155676 RepID=UPI00344FAD77